MLLEENGIEAKQNKGIISNPNCSTIQMVVALAPIYKKAGIKRIIVSTYQAASGAGRSALKQLWDEAGQLYEKSNLVSVAHNPMQIKYDKQSQPAFSHQIAFNVLAQIGGFGQDNYTSEEWKMVHETHKILGSNKIKISATCIRVPVLNAHS